MLSVFLSQPLTLLAHSVESATSAAKFQRNAILSFELTTITKLP
jgi:hypothetical protein